jgi:hypothetical protein
MAAPAVCFLVVGCDFAATDAVFLGVPVDEKFILIVGE